MSAVEYCHHPANDREMEKRDLKACLASRQGISFFYFSYSPTAHKKGETHFAGVMAL